MRDYAVVIPTRNRYELALRAIRSVLGQTVPPQEVHVVDDASTDRRYQWLEEIVDDARVTIHRRPISSRLEYDAGFAVGAVRNTALREIVRIGFEGWVAFLDDDDEWMPEKMARQFDAADAYDAYRVICTNAINRDTAGTICGFHHPDHGRQLLGTFWDVTALVKTLNPVINSTAIVHTEVARVLGDQWPSGYGEDWDYWRRAAVLTPILRIDEPLVFYTVGNLKEYRL